MLEDLFRDAVKRIQLLAYEGERLAERIEALKEKRSAVNRTIAENVVSFVSGGAMKSMFGGEAGRIARAATKQALRAQHEKQMREEERAIGNEVERWLLSIEEILNEFTVAASGFIPRGKGHLSVRKLARIQHYVKPETKVKHALILLRDILRQLRVWADDPALARGQDVKQPSAAYQILYDLETTLRVFIQKQLERVSSNWWRERVPHDVQERAERRKRQNETQWPWHEDRNLSLIHYVDFADYAKIITKRNNWNEVFKHFFKHRDAIAVKLRELEPIRNAIAHSRELTTAQLRKLELTAYEIVTCIKQPSRASESG